MERAAAIIDDDGAMTAYTLPLNAAAAAQLRDAMADYSMDGRIAGLVERAVAAWEEAGIHVVLAEGPLPERAVPFHPHGEDDLVAFEEELEAIAERTGATVVSLPDELRDDSLYQDYTHLNAEGAARYTAYLAGAMGASDGDR